MTVATHEEVLEHTGCSGILEKLGDTDARGLEDGVCSFRVLGEERMGDGDSRVLLEPSERLGIS